MTAADLRDRMRSAGLTVQALADRLGVSPDTVQSWRVGRRNPCCEHMRRAIDEALRRPSRQGCRQ